jgi:protein-tyrosine phosphatase
VEWFKANLKADRSDPLLLARPRFSAILELLRPLLGSESWDHFDWRDLSVTRRIVAQTVRAQIEPVMRRLRRSSANQDLLRHHKAVLAQIGNRPVNKIAFICLGNICRSPFAAHLAQEQIATAEIVSAGFHHKVGRPSPDKIVRIGSDFGIDLTQHRSQLVNTQLLKDADLILVMDSANMRQMQQAFPEQLARTTMLGLFAPTPKPSISDPYTAGAAETLKICVQIREAVSGLAVVIHQAFINQPCRQSSSSEAESLAGQHRP